MSSPEPTPPRRGSLLTIFLIVFIDLMGFGIVLPNLQLYGHDFGISNYFTLTLLGAVYSLFQFLFAPLLGKWSDRIGRRPVLLISQIGTLAGFLILFAAHFFESSAPGIGIAMIFASRVIDGISGGNISTASAYIADITPPEKRARGMGLIGAAFGLGFVFGPLLGGLVGGSPSLGLPYVPLAAGAFSLLAICMTFFYLPESHTNRAPVDPNEYRRFSVLGLRHALTRPVIAPLILMGFVNGFAFAGMEQTFSLLLQARLFPVTPAAVEEILQGPQSATLPATTEISAAPSAEQIRAVTRMQDARASRASGMLFFFIGLIIAFIQGEMIHRLTKKFGEPALIITGPILVAAGLVAIGLPFPLWDWKWSNFAIGNPLLAIGSSLFNPSMQSLISRHAGAHEQGEVLGASQGMASLARVLGPIVAGLLFQYISPGAPYYLSAAITLGVALAAAGMKAKLQPPSPLINKTIYK